LSTVDLAATLWVKKSEVGTGSCIFRQTATDFHQRRLWVPIILILLL